MRHFNLIFIFALALSFFFILNNGVQAQCESESGAAYGLCIAYCTMGCDGTSMDPEGCDTVSAKYMQFTGEEVSCDESCKVDNDCERGERCCPDGRCLDEGLACPVQLP